ncbi:MAG: cation-efflux pump [Nitrososphaera sp.]|nr:cation-efflux pump [Nitrososphaera sp.]
MSADRLATTDVGAIKRNTLRISLLAISSVFVFEFIAGISTNSLALLTDSTHALLDVVVTLVFIIASTLALKPRDVDHTYGHGKIETIGGFIGGIALFVVAIFFIYEAVSRITGSPQSVSLVNPGTIGFAAVIYTLFVDVFRIIVLKRADSKTGASTIRADLYHSFADLASTAVAFAGLWFVSAGFVHGDSVAAIGLGAVLAYLSTRFAYRNAIELTDVISPKLVARVRQAANGTDGVLKCTDIRMRRVGREIFVEVTVALRGDMSFEMAHETSAVVEENIAKTLASTGLFATPSDVTVHFEPILSVDIAPEAIIEKAATAVNGVRGVHNILVSTIGGSSMIGVSLHIQVNRSATLTEAHSIADSVEESIKNRLKGVGTITVHLEPRMPDIRGLQPLSDSEIQDSIRKVIGNMNDIVRISRVEVYRTDDKMLKIDVECAFKSGPENETTIEEIHERVSEIEKQIRGRYPGSIVTVHAEPS